MFWNPCMTDGNRWFDPAKLDRGCAIVHLIKDKPTLTTAFNPSFFSPAAASRPAGRTPRLGRALANPGRASHPSQANIRSTVHSFSKSVRRRVKHLVAPRLRPRPALRPPSNSCLSSKNTPPSLFIPWPPRTRLGVPTFQHVYMTCLLDPLLLKLRLRVGAITRMP